MPFRLSFFRCWLALWANRLATASHDDSGTMMGGTVQSACTGNTWQCFATAYDSQGMYVFNESDYQCLSFDVMYCAYCGDNAVQCTGSWGGLECLPSSMGCPETCTAGQVYGYVDNYTADGTWVSSSQQCCPVTSDMMPDCPCGDNTIKCTETMTWEGSTSSYSWCQASAFGCPVSCNWETQFLCTPESFDASGMLLPSSQAGTCKAIGEPCQCGSNAVFCSDEWGGWCMPQQVDGYNYTCPVTCDWTTQQLCFSCNYDSSGRETGCTETCIAIGSTCQCGTNAKTCTYFDFSWCAGPNETCPVVCEGATPKECYYNSYDGSGMWLSSTSECVASGTTCDCSKGTNAVACQWDAQFTDCMSTQDHALYCPATCTGTEVPCPPVDNYDSQGNWVSTAAANPACAASYHSCACGTGAHLCTDTWGGYCMPSNIACPKTCTSAQQLCWLFNYDANGNELTESTECVANNTVCPCGSNSHRCPGEDWCQPTSEQCACRSTQTLCVQDNYDGTGSLTSVKEVCVNRGTACPPGTNTKTCADPENSTILYHVPKKTADGKDNACPAPCTAAQEAQGKETCYTPSFNAAGDWVSESITCKDKGTCSVGQNVKNCSSSCALVGVGAKCKNVYGISSCNTVDANTEGKIQTSKAIIPFSTITGSVSTAAKKVKAGLDGLVQPPTGIKTKVTLVPKTSSRRLADGRILTAQGGHLVVEVSNYHAAAVAPSKVTSEIQKKVKTRSTDMNGVLGNVGTVNTQSGVSLSTSTVQRSTASSQVQESGRISGAPEQAWLRMLIITSLATLLA